MEKFTSDIFRSPTGILFYGPSATRTTGFFRNFLEFLEVKLVTEPLVSYKYDFNYFYIEFG